MLRNWITRLLQRVHQSSRQQRRFSKRTASYRPRLEQLEDLTLPATITWNGSVDHSLWNVANNWALQRLPAAGDDVVIPNTNVNGTTAVTLTGTAANIDSLTSSLPVNLQGTTLTTTGGGSVATGGLMLTNNAAFTITGGGDLSVITNSQSLLSSDNTGAVVFGDANGGNAV